MQTTSATYQTIVAGNHWFETRVSINGNWLTEDDIFSVSRDRPGMPSSFPSVGGALSSTLSLIVKSQNFTIPKMATVIVQFRVTNRAEGAEVTNDNTSGWVAGGTYFIDTRAYDQSGIGTLAITAFDAMMKAEQDYPDTNHNWPYLDTSVVSEIATQIGVTVDSRTAGFLISRYMIEAPTTYTMREVLEHIAAMYGGNFIITPENKLLFVPLYGLDPEANLTGNYLKEDGSTKALRFGNEGWYILV